MEQRNPQELNSRTFSDLIYDPSTINADDSVLLESLVEKYPYSQLIRSFYARSLSDADPLNFEKELVKAAVISPDRTVLRTIIEEADLFTKGTDRVGLPTPIDDEETTPDTPSFTEIETKSRLVGDRIEGTSTEPIGDLNVEVSPVEKLTVQEDEEEHGTVPEKPDEIEDLVVEEPERIEEEIVVIRKSPQNDENQEDTGHDEVIILAENLKSEDRPEIIETPADENEEDELDILIKQNAVSVDYLQNKQSPDPVADEQVFTPEVELPGASRDTVVDDQQKVSRYDDDKMPYSFLWWLNKTRKEHTENYQPYVSFQLDTSQSIKRNAVDQLSSQIIENIFHLQSPVDQLENAPRTVPFQVKRKEDYILEKFIREEPQIRPPNSDNLDTENKARKSAEDPNDLVSETLAHIYTDQMLFHKAIETYKKLSLKFPEKSTYFADQILELEKKIN